MVRLKQKGKYFMRYFKLIKDHNIIGIIDDNNFRKYQKKHKIIVFSNVEDAEFIEYKNQFYWDTWLNPYPAQDLSITISLIKIDEIDEEEYNILKETLQTEQEILLQQQPQVEEPQPPMPPQEENPVPDDTLEYVKRVKIAEIQKANQNKLKKGFDIVLKTGVKHISMAQDGLFNLIVMLTDPNMQEEKQQIVQEMLNFKNICNAYTDILIQQVNNSVNISDINNIHYKEEEIIL